MRSSLKALLFAMGWLLVTISTPATSPDELLRIVSHKYESLNKFEFEVSEKAQLPGTDCVLEVPATITRSLPANPETISFHHSRLSKACFDAIQKLGSIRMPGEWAHFETLNVGVSSVRSMAEETLRLHSQAILCVVLEVTYEEYYQKLRSYDGPIRYWIDLNTNLVRRADFQGKTSEGTSLWTAIVEEVKLMESGVPDLSVHLNLPLIVGEPAPEFVLRTVDGSVVHLTDFKGKVLILAFWATWCASCDEEIPFFEKLQTEADLPNVVILGVTDENADDVRKWMDEYKRSFRTLVNAKIISDAFGVKSIPALLTINRDGIVTDFDSGLHPQRQILDIVRKLSADSTK
jgi:cytochrome c biogenesis protein CcmG, thiol:disulfide interchange protein DsbE